MDEFKKSHVHQKCRKFDQRLTPSKEIENRFKEETLHLIKHYKLLRYKKIKEKNN